MDIPVVRGKRLRATVINKCGKPIQGPANRLVTSGFISIKLEPELKQANELETKNADGKVCVSDRTAPEIKRHNATLVLCGVNPDLYSMFAGYERILDYDDKPIGYADQPDVLSDRGVMIEVWAGGEAEDDCDETVNDSIFSATGTGEKFGYLSFASKEWIPTGFTVEEAIANFTLNGITMPAPNWGRSPYNVAAIDSSNTAGRLLAPVGKKRHLTFFRTPIAPPPETDGACELAIQSIFTNPNYYIGGPAGEPAADVAPPQPICGGKSYTVVVTGTGNWKMKVGVPASANIAHTALPAAVQSAIEALANVEVGQVQVTGTAGNYTVTLDPSLPVLTSDSTGLTGGTATVTAL